jgi:preprotein translocase subunit YajC
MAWAQEPAPGGAAGGPLAAVIQFVPFLLIFAIFYFLIIRPQQKRQKEHQKMIDAVQKGDEVTTAGGIVGTVVGVHADRIVLRIDKSTNTKVEFLKSAVTGVLAGKKDAVE